MAEEITYANHAVEKLRGGMDETISSTKAQVNLHHARTYALVSIARSLEAIEGHLAVISRVIDSRMGI